MTRVPSFLCVCLALAACADLTALPPADAPAAIAAAPGASAAPAGAPGAVVRSFPEPPPGPLPPVSLSRAACGADAALALEPRCAALDRGRSAAQVPQPDSADWFAAGQADAARRDAAIGLDRRRLELDSGQRPVFPEDRRALARDRQRLEQEALTAPYERLRVAPYARTTGLSPF